MPGVFRLKFGKRRALISLSKLDTMIGIVPSDDDCRAALNETSAPGDSVAGPLNPVHRMDTGSVKQLVVA